jgi:hypothetical protein
VAGDKNGGGCAVEEEGKKVADRREKNWGKKLIFS